MYPYYEKELQREVLIFLLVAFWHCLNNCLDAVYLDCQSIGPYDCCSNLRMEEQGKPARRGPSGTTTNKQAKRNSL
jgi:hypothetical protein